MKEISNLVCGKCGTVCKIEINEFYCPKCVCLISIRRDSALSCSACMSPIIPFIDFVGYPIGICSNPDCPSYNVCKSKGKHIITCPPVTRHPVGFYFSIEDIVLETGVTMMTTVSYKTCSTGYSGQGSEHYLIPQFIPEKYYVHKFLQKVMRNHYERAK